MNRKPLSLREFHFDRTKSGEVLHAWVKTCPKQRKEIIADTGLSEDAFNNCIYGRSQDLYIDRAFKIAVATGHTLSEYIARVLPPPDELDFANRIRMPNVDELTATYAEIFAAYADAAAATTDVAQIADMPSGFYRKITEEHNRQLDRFRNVYATLVESMKKQIDDLRADRDAMRQQHAEELRQMERLYAENIARADDQIFRLRRRCAHLGGKDYDDVLPDKPE